MNYALQPCFVFTSLLPWLLCKLVDVAFLKMDQGGGHFDLWGYTPFIFKTFLSEWQLRFRCALLTLRDKCVCSS